MKILRLILFIVLPPLIIGFMYDAFYSHPVQAGCATMPRVTLDGDYTWDADSGSADMGTTFQRACVLTKVSIENVDDSKYCGCEIREESGKWRLYAPGVDYADAHCGATCIRWEYPP